ncbi:MAG: GNAT family N-acetyltransferase [Alphaproteobacteria bacterium]|jgi:ribosomal protein S18 acetylase RimI-like enzyme|nr:GNAT family N-acetyltransferase [Alphaproteobacteria bacterium]
MKACVIRQAQETDADLLAAFWRDRFTETFGSLYPPRDLAAFLSEAYAPQTILAEIADPGFTHHLAWDEEEHSHRGLVGALKTGRVGLPLPDRSGLWELHRLYLHPAAFGTGLADRFMAVARAQARAAGATSLVLGVYCDNHRAQRFYARHGFARIGAYQFPVGLTLDDEWILCASL